MSALVHLIKHRVYSSFEKGKGDDSKVLSVVVLKDHHPLGGSTYFPEHIQGAVYLAGSEQHQWTSSSLFLCIQHKECSETMVCAFYVIESTTALLSYIQWIETSGQCTPLEAQSGITKALLKAYIDYTIINGHTLSLFSNGQLASPFFFRNSKRAVLNPSQLKSWWSFLLSEYEPMVTSWQPSSQSEFPFLSKKAFLNDDGDADAMDSHVKTAQEVIPLFPDDPMTRHLQTFKSSPSINLESFCSSLGFRPEYAGGGGTHFWIKPPRNHSSTSNETNTLYKRHANDGAKNLLCRWIDSIFYELDFSNAELSVESTRLLLRELENLDSKIDILSFSISDINLNGRMKSTMYSQAAISNNSICNNIQNLVRRARCT